MRRRFGRSMSSLFCLFALICLLVAIKTGGCDGVDNNDMMVSTRTVITNLTLPDDGLIVVDMSDTGTQACIFRQDKRDVLLMEQILLNGNTSNWQKGENLYIAKDVPPGFNLSESEYAIVFLHGASEIIPTPPLQPPRIGPPCSPEQNVNAEIAMVEELLDELGGGIAMFPQALPKFRFDVACLLSEAETIQCYEGEKKDYNAWCDPSNPQWLPPLEARDIIDTCYANVSAAWYPFFDEYVSRVEEFVNEAHKELGIPFDRIYLLGFSQGAVMAQHALIALAANGIALGGGIGFDGAEVEMMASRDILEKLTPDMTPNILYFLYSSPNARVAQCLNAYPGLHVQVHNVANDTEKLPYHAVYRELVQPTKLWIEAKNKNETLPAVEEAWLKARHKAFARAKKYPC